MSTLAIDPLDIANKLLPYPWNIFALAFVVLAMLAPRAWRAGADFKNRKLKLDRAKSELEIEKLRLELELLARRTKTDIAPALERIAAITDSTDDAPPPLPRWKRLLFGAIGASPLTVVVTILTLALKERTGLIPFVIGFALVSAFIGAIAALVTRTTSIFGTLLTGFVTTLAAVLVWFVIIYAVAAAALESHEHDASITRACQRDADAPRPPGPAPSNSAADTSDSDT